jgi:branched-chain amino acid transport system substrate-binding protein
MKTRSTISRRAVLAGTGGFIVTPALIGSASAATRGVTDTEIVIGTTADLSGVAAAGGVNGANGIRMAFDEINARGGVHGRKINWVLEDMQYIVPKAVQAMNKLLNHDNIFFAIGDNGTPHNDAVMPSMFEKNVPNVFPATCARSMYEPFNRLKFGQFSSYYDQMRAGVKYFVEQRGKKVIGSMYQDTDFGKDVHAGVTAQLEAMGLKVAAVTAHRPTDTDFNAALARQQDAGCDLIFMGTIIKDTTIILQTARKMGWDVEFCGQYASYSSPVAEAPGEAAEGFYSMSPALFRYPDDPDPKVHAFCEAYRKRFGIDVSYPGQAGYTAASFVIAALDKAGRDLTLDSFIGALESMKDWHDIFGGPALSMSPTNHHASSQSFLSVVKKTRWTPVMEQPLSF